MTNLGPYCRTKLLGLTEWESPRINLSVCNRCALVLLAVLNVCVFGVGQRVGDGEEYYLTLISVAENLTPYTTDRTGQIYDDYFLSKGRSPTFSCYSSVKGNRAVLPTEPGQVEFQHAWFYSSLAAVFYWPLKWAGQDIGLSFNLLHVALLLWVAWLTDKLLGPRATLSLILLVVYSPVFWFINKGHTEFFTVMVTTAAIVYFLRGRYAPCALWFAIASTQNPPFAMIALVALIGGLLKEKSNFVLRNKLALTATVAVAGLHPGYYLLKFGALTPTLVTGSGSMTENWLPIRQVAAIWVDPDVGVLCNWLLALPLALLFLFLCYKRFVRVRANVIVLAIFAVVILGWSQTRIHNVNHGGTVDISRYCLWFFFLWFAVQWRVIDWLATQRRRLALAICVVALVPALYTTWQYRPGLPETSCSPTRVSFLLYGNAPWLYDPPPEVFHERYVGSENLSTWAVSHPSGNKILVYANNREQELPDPPPPVSGCSELDSAAVRAAAREAFAAQPDRYHIYLNGMGSSLKRGGGP